MILQFQSTRPRGARLQRRLEHHGRPVVSIHAPAWGATSGRLYPRREIFRFNPRARVGRDQALSICFASPDWFQSTRPRGARRGIGITLDVPCEFQSTRPRGARRDFSIASAGACLFQSTRPRGARHVAWHIVALFWGFQSTRPRGARLSPSWTNTNYSTKQSYIQAATKLTKITRPAVPQFCCQGTRANIVINQHHLPFARHRARQLAKPQGHKVSSHQNAPPFFANSSRGYIRAGYLLTHQ